jgi:hypothetical protein
VLGVCRREVARVLSVELIYIPLSCDRVVQAFFPSLGSLSLSLYLSHGVVQAFFPTLGPEHPPHRHTYIHTVYVCMYVCSGPLLPTRK